jgi:hypothetical protein
MTGCLRKQGLYILPISVLLLGLVASGCGDDDPGTSSESDTGADAGQDVTADQTGDTTPDQTEDVVPDQAEDIVPDQTEDVFEDQATEPDAAANNPPVPTAPAIETFKNDEGTSQVIHGDPDDGDTQSYAVTTEPTNGTATVSDAGLVTYTPNSGYAGVDELIVTVTDGADATGMVTISVTVTNRPPVPIAPAIEIVVGESGTSQVVHGDPDTDDTFTYEVTVQPGVGTAEISETGLLTYTSIPNGIGPTNATVRVTDGTGATGDVVVDVTVGMAPVGLPGPLPEELCDSGEDRVSLVSITPAPGTTLTAGATITFEAVVSYQVTEAWDVEVRYDEAASPTSSVAAGCGETTLSAEVTVPDDGSTLFEVELVDAEFYVVYPINTGAEITQVSFDTVSYPMGVPITDPLFEIMVTISYDLLDLADAYNNNIGIIEGTGTEFYYVTSFPVTPEEGQLVRLFGTLACGDQYATFYIFSYLEEDTDYIEATHYLSWPAVPPSIAVDNWATHIPVNSGELTLTEIGVEDCVGDRALTVTVPDEFAAWLSVDLTDLDGKGFFNVVINGADLPVGEETWGNVVITGGDDGGADVYELQVSAVRHDFDFSADEWNVVDLVDKDDAYGTISLDTLVFPFAGVDITTIYPNSNGMIGLGDSCGLFFLDGFENPNDFFDEVNPDLYGCPLLAPFWSDHGFFDALEGDDVSDVYYREVTVGDATHLEILYWDLNSYSEYHNHDVFFVRLFDDGTFEYEYLQMDLLGTETVGWFREDGSAGELFPVWDNAFPGNTVSMGPVEAIVD